MKYKTFSETAGDYLEYRRSLGVALCTEGEELRRFARYADQVGHKGPITTELALQWAKLPEKCYCKYWASRLDIVRRFARYMKLLVPDTEIPPGGLLGPSYRRPTPHIYSEEEITAIMEAAGNLRPRNGLRPHTYVTLFGLLASTGMRISEAIHMSRDDLDIDPGVITVEESKYSKSRIVPLHPTALEALKSYISKRDKRHPFPKTKAFFVSERGTFLRYKVVSKAFREIVFRLGWCKGKGERGPTIHDLRHTFASRRLLEWYRNGDDVHQKVPELSTYLGHAQVGDTYWYLTAVPELMAIAASRFEGFAFKGGL
jgi:integrase